MKAIFSRITAFFLAILAFFGLSPKQAKPEGGFQPEFHAVRQRGLVFFFGKILQEGGKESSEGGRRGFRQRVQHTGKLFLHHGPVAFAKEIARIPKG